jgi:hypothetical protein
MKSLPLAAVALLMVGGPALAHHPFASEFDANAPVTLTGTVEGVNWNNPHVNFRVAVKDNSGETRNWTFQAASPATLQKKGWTKTTLKEGEKITMQGYRAKSEPFVAAARMISLPNGKKLSSASNDGGPQT